MSSGQFFRCRCYLTNNYFLKKYNLHVTFVDKRQFEQEYDTVLRNLGCVSEQDWEEVYDLLKTEFLRRSNVDVDSQERRRQIMQKYVPLHKDIYTLQESFLNPDFVRLVALCKQDLPKKDVLASFKDASLGKKLYTFRIFTPEFCEKFIEEVMNFEQSPLPKGRPNTMNNYGILLDELGMDEGLLMPLREDYLSPMSSVLFPFWTGDALDSHRAFVVAYKLGNDVDLDRHYDNAEVTLNLCLGADFEGGELYFAGMQTEVQDDSQRTVFHNKPLVGLLHRARHIHGAMPILSGSRYNLIIWMRSSSVRNQLCPMCMEKPRLVPSHRFGDGFTQVKLKDQAQSQEE